jgi:predicted nucleic acid-binding protein
MRVYLDVCCLQRPLDDRSQLRINVEAEAILAILRLVEARTIELLSSEVIEFEVDRILDPERRLRVREISRLAGSAIELSREIETAAEALVKTGVKPVDALHLATASAAKSDYFCTCDDELLKKRPRMAALAMKIVSPLELMSEVVP